MSYRNALRDAIRDAVRKKEQGLVDRYVIDLRGNQGGNMWPMYAGILPLIGDGDVGATFAVSGDDGQSHGHVLIDGTQLELYRRPYHLDALASTEPGLLHLDDVEKDLETPVTVLIDEHTSSSGEILAVIFRGRANTRIEGTSAGAPTSNMRFELADDILFLTAGVCADRHGMASVKSLTSSQSQSADHT